MHDADVRLGDELGAQKANEAVVQFDGDHTASLGRKPMRQDAEAGADFEDNILRRQIRRGDDAVQVMLVDQEVLAE